MKNKWVKFELPSATQIKEWMKEEGAWIDFPSDEGLTCCSTRWAFVKHCGQDFSISEFYYCRENKVTTAIYLILDGKENLIDKILLKRYEEDISYYRDPHSKKCYRDNPNRYDLRSAHVAPVEVFV